MEEPGEKLVGPEAAIETESELIKIALQILFTQAMVGPKEESFYVGNYSVYPVQSVTVLVKNLELVRVFST